MNVTTIGFPFGAAPGVPGAGTAGQGFALALGAAGLGGIPRIGAGAANDLIPTFANDAVPARPGANPLVRTQAGPSITLAQLLAAGSKTPAAADAAQPGLGTEQIAADLAVPPPADTNAQPADANAQPATAPLAKLPADAAAPAIPAQDPAQLPVVADAAEPAVTAKPEPQPDKAEAEVEIEVEAEAAQPEAVPAPAPKGPSPDPATAVATDKDKPLPLPANDGDQPQPLDLPTAGRPTGGTVPTPPAATPVKTRKAIAVDREGTALPADPLPSQPAATPAIVAGPTPPPAPAVAPPERKPDNGRGAKAAPAALAQANVPVPADAMAPAAKPGKEADTPSFEAPATADTAQPADLAAKAEPRTAGAAPAPQQSFASHVAQSAAPAPAPAPIAASADPMVPARAGQLGHALGVEIARKVEAGENTLRVRMNPAELGRVEVTLAFDDNGRLHATMRAESQHALDLLRQDAPDLGRALDSAGIRTDTQSFRFESRGDGNGGSGSQPGQQQSRGQGHQPFDEEPETATPAYRPIRNDGQVDLLA